MKRATLARAARRWHRPMAWLGALALVVFGISGISHPLMTWFGPQPAAFFPPQGTFAAGEMAAIPRVLRQQGISGAELVRLVPTAAGNRLQVTLAGQPQRRYFELDSGRELPDYDRQQAVWLARHYTGLWDAEVREVALQTGFDNAYPEVNRLLPVWRVALAGEGNPVAFVHTELNALAALGNDFRTAQQALFRSLHTLAWLEERETVRVIVLALLCIALILMAFSGMAMVVCAPRPRSPRGGRRWHRYLAFGLWLPLLAFASSGLYHLLHNSGHQPAGGLVPAPPLDLVALEDAAVPADLLWQEPRVLNSVTLLTAPDEGLLLRLAPPAGRQGEHVHHQRRFDGVPGEGNGILLPLGGGSEQLGDRVLARHYAALHLGETSDGLGPVEQVTRFGPDYDFRNKRLPVWRVVRGDDILFIDPANGALVDVVSVADRREATSFSHLHKWNFLTPLVGRQGRDLMVVLVILLLLGTTALGVAMLRPGRRAASWRRQQRLT